MFFMTTHVEDFFNFWKTFCNISLQLDMIKAIKSQGDKALSAFQESYRIYYYNLLVTVTLDCDPESVLCNYRFEQQEFYMYTTRSH